MTIVRQSIRWAGVVLCFGPLAGAGCGGSPSRAAAPVTPVAGRPAAEPAPRRPALPKGADTCDPNAYYQFARTQLRRHPAVAAAAYYWMQRLSPDSPNAYYSERVALLLADGRMLRGYFDDDRRTLESPRVRRIDSLQVRALELDPFFPQYLEEELIVSYYTFVIGNEIRSQTSSSAGPRDEQIEAYVRNELNDHADSSTRAWLEYARGGYREAADYWAQRLQRDSANSHLRAWRAKALFLAGAWDSARAELVTALAAAHRSDARQMKYVYDSKEMWEYEVGWIDELQKHDSAAREAYQRALLENLSFYPAHLRLALLALRQRDTTTAVAELQRTIEIKDDEFTARLLFGAVLAARHDAPGATEQLRGAAAAEPWVAYPHFVLANTRLDAGDRAGAAAEYRRFLDLAPSTDPNVAAARQRLSTLPPAPAP